MKGHTLRGCYILVMAVREDDIIPVGRLGSILFRAGGYAYVGSALSGLESRLRRHQRKDKRLHWHIDYLLQRAQLTQMIWAQTRERFECRLAHFLSQHFECIAGFGASDCGCRGHLFRAPEEDQLPPVAIEAMRSCGLVPGRRYCCPKNSLT